MRIFYTHSAHTPTTTLYSNDTHISVSLYAKCLSDYDFKPTTLVFTLVCRVTLVEYNMSLLYKSRQRKKKSDPEANMEEWQRVRHVIHTRFEWMPIELALANKLEIKQGLDLAKLCLYSLPTIGRWILSRRSSKNSHRKTMVVFPIAIRLALYIPYGRAGVLYLICLIMSVCERVRALKQYYRYYIGSLSLFLNCIRVLRMRWVMSSCVCQSTSFGIQSEKKSVGNGNEQQAKVNSSRRYSDYRQRIC